MEKRPPFQPSWGVSGERNCVDRHHKNAQAESRQAESFGKAGRQREVLCVVQPFTAKGLFMEMAARHSHKREPSSGNKGRRPPRKPSICRCSGALRLPRCWLLTENVMDLCCTWSLSESTENLSGGRTSHSWLPAPPSQRGLHLGLSACDSLLITGSWILFLPEPPRPPPPPTFGSF